MEYSCLQDMRFPLKVNAQLAINPYCLRHLTMSDIVYALTPVSPVNVAALSTAAPAPAVKPFVVPVWVYGAIAEVPKKPIAAAEPVPSPRKHSRAAVSQAFKTKRALRLASVLDTRSEEHTSELPARFAL